MAEKKISEKELNTTNYAIIELAYTAKAICLPYKDAVVFMSALEKAEHVETNYDDTKITFLDSHIKATFNIIPDIVYKRRKMDKLLGVENENTNSD